MATSWCRLMDWFYRTYDAHRGEPGWSFTEEVVAHYVEADDLQELYDGSGDRVRDRISAIRALRPRRRID